MIISDAYRELQAEYHRQEDGYGVACLDYAKMVSAICDETGVDAILDYGSGKGRLGPAMWTKKPVVVTSYEPAFGMEPPNPHDFVVCLDVLEHVEPDCLTDVLDDLKRVTRRWGLFSICEIESGHVLPDGRNAHLIVQSEAFWLSHILSRFRLLKFGRLHPYDFWVFVKEKVNA